MTGNIFFFLRTYNNLHAKSIFQGNSFASTQIFQFWVIWMLIIFGKTNKQKNTKLIS